MVNGDHVQLFQARTRQRTVAVISRQPCEGVFDTVFEAGNYDIVFIESIDRAYSQIKRTAPDVVILCLDSDDAAGLQVLSMLKLDDKTSSIPVMTYLTIQNPPTAADRSLERDFDALSTPLLLQ